MLSLPAAAAARDASPAAGTIRQVEALFAPFATSRGLLLAVSGGPDSMALLRLAAAWRAAVETPIHVATIDHGLRPAARAEAALVARWASAQGLPHHLLTWEGAKPASRLQEAARSARYRLLTAKAVALGCDHIVTAHHADDQAETILFRFLRGSGPSGLAGMAPMKPLGPVTLARPLLGLGKDELVAHCQSLGQAFLEDPSNADPAYARTRMRQLVTEMRRHGLDRDALLRLGQRAARVDAALAPQVEAATAAVAIEHTTEGLHLDAVPLGVVPEEIALRVLRHVIGTLVPAVTLRLQRLEALAGALRTAIQTGVPHAATLGGVLLRLDRIGGLTLRREAPRRRGRKASLFDGAPP